SAGGLALEVDALLQVGDLLQVELSCGGEPVFITLASVVRAGTEPGGQHVIGCNFIGELPEDKLARLLGEQAG
ncbi:MAG: PilZ domain-containing protein, partial [Gemmataceae bacterium]|nr:PilZ domain-containing protein [Gemmataceae bacterium]